MNSKIKLVVTFCVFLAIASNAYAQLQVTCIRNMPDNYTPGQNVIVTLTIDVDESNPPVVIGIEDIFPDGWTYVSSDPEQGYEPGVVESEHKLGWLFWAMGSPVQDTVITYVVTPPADETGTKTFSGTVDVDEEPSEDIGGNTDIEGPSPPQPTVGFSSTSSGYSEATSPVILPVVLSEASAEIVKVAYAVSGGTATQGEDYTLDSGILTFSPGNLQPDNDIKITVVSDSLYEADETIIVTLSSPVNATLGIQQHIYTINNDDLKPTIKFSLESSSGNEDNSPAQLTVIISSASGLPATVGYSVVPGGTATSGEDYTPISDTLTFPAESIDSQTISIPIIPDKLDEDNETFIVKLSNATNADIGTASHKYTILDNDDPPSVSFTIPSKENKEGAVSQVTLVVNLTPKSGRTVTVGYSVSVSSTATRGEDYILDDGTLIFLPGETTKNIMLTILDDDFGEPAEKVIVTLSAASPTVEPGTYMEYTYKILNDDLPSVAFAAASSEGPEADSPAILPVVLSPFLGEQVTVEYNVDPAGTAQAPEDYIAFTPGTLIFPAGAPADEVTLNIEIDITHDTEVEPDETIIVTLSNPTGALIGANESHTYTILNDDDNTLPEISDFIPEPDSIQVARDTIIQLHITDEVIAGTTSGTGVALETVSITVENDVIYDGGNETSPGVYDSNSIHPEQAVRGICRCVGSEEDYTFVFQSSTQFDYEQEVNVTVNAKDKAGNIVNETYHFHTVMRSFRKNIKVNTDTGTLAQNRPASAMDSKGNIWVVWDEKTAAGDTDIYIGKLPADGGTFETSMPVIKGANDQRNPAIAIDGDDNLYVVWEEFADPNWNILLLTSDNGIDWTYELDSDPCQVNADDKAPNITQNPAIAISGDEMYITWDEKRAGNKDIWVRKSDIGQAKFDWKVATPVTEHASSQSEPAIAIDEFGTAYIVWTDERNPGSTDIYGAASTSWNDNKEVVNTDSNQSSPVAAVSEDGVVHLLWVDDENGYADIFYGNDASGLPIEGTTIVDEPDTVQSSPAIAVNGTKIFACWQDGRWIDSGDVADIYFAESGSGFDDRNNVLVNDDGVYENTQTAPDIGDIGVDKYGNPYIVWVDDRNGNNDIYYAGPITIGDPLTTIVEVNDVDAFTLVEATTPDDLKVTVKIPNQPLGVDPNDITIREVDVNDLPQLPPGSFGVPYDLGPSGLVFSPPVTVTIQHAEEDCPDHPVNLVFWYDTQTGTWSRDGITDDVHLTDAQDPNLPDDVHAMRFKTTHFTSFGTGGGTLDAVSGADGGGCEISPTGQGNVIEYMLPYVLLTVVWVIIKRKDARNRKTA